MDVPVPARFFSLREANSLVDVLQEKFTRARELRDQLVGLHEKLAEAGVSLEGLDVQIDPAAPPAVQRLLARAAEVVERLRELLSEVTQLGVEVKAADGLVDFRTRLHGRTVYLCWKYGEARIEHYHELTTGFAGRRALPSDGDFVGDLLH